MSVLLGSLALLADSAEGISRLADVADVANAVDTSAVGTAPGSDAVSGADVVHLADGDEGDGDGEGNGFNFRTNPSLPTFEGGNNPLQTIFNWGQGIVVVIGIIGVLFAAGKMAIGKFGRSDLAADGVGSLVWVVFGISLMLIAIPIILTIGGVNGD